MRRITALSLAVLVAGCPGLQDFSQELSGGYFIHRLSANEILIAPDGWSADTPIIPSLVVELAFDANWVIAKQQHLRPRNLFPSDDLREPAPGEFSFWILNVKEPRAWGPLRATEFDGLRASLRVPNNLELRDVYSYRR